MRRLFDQYRFPENKLTHALVSSLARSPVLLKNFVTWVSGEPPPQRKIWIVEQTLPGQEEEADEDAAMRKGLPDAWIYSEDGWALIIESKVASRLHMDQLERHLRVARRRGFLKPTLVVLCAISENGSLPAGGIQRTWKDVYQWAVGQQKTSEWAGELTAYMEVLEAKMVSDGYLKDGMLTKFTGVPFNRDHPYSYLEAKRVLRLLLEELRKNRTFVRKMGIDLTLPGRGAIKGQSESSVWDFMRLKESAGTKSFRKHPHLTISIGSGSVHAFAIFPNNMKRSSRRKMLGRDIKEFRETILRVANGMESVIKREPLARPLVEVLQRHSPSRAAVPIRDASLSYDPRTAIGGSKRVKRQAQWLEVTRSVLDQKRSNLQLAVGVEIPYGKSRLVKSADLVSLLETAFLATVPLVNVAMNRN